MEKCWRYNRAQAPSYSNQEELEELLSWGQDATIDPISGKDYPDTYSGLFWMSFKWETGLFCNSFNLHYFRFSDRETEGVWKNFYTNQIVDTSIGMVGVKEVVQS